MALLRLTATEAGGAAHDVTFVREGRTSHSIRVNGERAAMLVGRRGSYYVEDVREKGKDAGLDNLDLVGSLKYVKKRIVRHVTREMSSTETAAKVRVSFKKRERRDSFDIVVNGKIYGVLEMTWFREVGWMVRDLTKLGEKIDLNHAFSMGKPTKLADAKAKIVEYVDLQLNRTASTETADEKKDEPEVKWTKDMVAQVADDLTEMVGTGIHTGCLNGRKVKSYKELVANVLKDYLPEQDEPARAALHSILRSDQRMMVWAKGDGRKYLLDAVRNLDHARKGVESATTEATKLKPHEAYEAASLRRGEQVLVNRGSLDAPRVQAGVVRRTNDVTGEVLVALANGDDLSRDARWLHVNDDPVGVIGVHNGHRLLGRAEGKVGRYLDRKAWVAAGMLDETTGVVRGFPTKPLEEEDTRPRTTTVHDLAPVVPKQADLDTGDEQETHMLEQLLEDGFPIKLLNRAGESGDAETVVQVDDVLMYHRPNDPSWTLVAGDHRYVVPERDLPFQLDRLV